MNRNAETASVSNQLKFIKMKTQIEHPLSIPLNPIKAMYLLKEFNNILDVCIYCQDKTALRHNMLPFQDSINFAYGFGGHHMWVKQRYEFNPGTIKDNRLLFVEL
jgi:hypothetical protein